MPQYFYTSLNVESDEILPNELLDIIFGSFENIQLIKDNLNNFKLDTNDYIVNAWIKNISPHSFTINYNGLDKPNIYWISKLSTDFKSININSSWYNENLEEAGQIEAINDLIKQKNYYGLYARNYCSNNHDEYSSILINKYTDLESGEIYWIEKDIIDSSFDEKRISDIEFHKYNYETDWEIISC